jgi:hypothetical protein
MKRLLLVAALAAGLLGLFAADAAAGAPPGIGANPCRRVGRIEGYWMQPSRGPLYDYSAYFAMMYPQLPGSGEYLPQQQNSGVPGPNEPSSQRRTRGYAAPPAWGR